MINAKLGIDTHDYVFYGKDICHYNGSAHKLSKYEASLIEQLYECVDFSTIMKCQWMFHFLFTICTKEEFDRFKKVKTVKPSKPNSRVPPTWYKTDSDKEPNLHISSSSNETLPFKMQENTFYAHGEATTSI